MMRKLIIPVAISAIASACGGGSSSSNDSPPDSEIPTQLTGTLVDSPVINIGYRTNSSQGVTNNQGQFQYQSGENVTFFIGDLEFPSAPAAATVTPLDLAGETDTSSPEVVNMLRLLQTLDQDGDADNGITITEEAKAAASAINFDVPVNEFESSPAVTNLVSNSGSSNTSLISVTDAVNHFEETLEDITGNIEGVWTTTTTDNDLLAFVFFDDGTYLHLEVDEEAPFDEENEESGMEWGSYSRNPISGQLTVTQTFDNNGDTGLTDFVGKGTLFAQVDGDSLTMQFDDNNNGSIEADESLTFSRTAENGLQGAWFTTATDNDLLAFIFFADGTYVHAEVDEQAPFDEQGETSGMEWGTYSRNSANGQLTVTQTFDNNGDTGLTDFVGESTLFAQLSGNSLTLQFDDNNNGSIDGDESLEFERL